MKKQRKLKRKLSGKEYLKRKERIQRRFKESIIKIGR